VFGVVQTRNGDTKNMKVCPKCGYVDYSMWRQNRWRTNVEFLKMEYATDDVDPKILTDVKVNGFAKDNHYAYRLSNATQPIIERITRAEFDSVGMQGFHVPREKMIFRLKKSGKQSKLVEGKVRV